VAPDAEYCPALQTAHGVEEVNPPAEKDPELQKMQDD